VTLYEAVRMGYDNFQARQRPVRRPKASVELPRSVAEHAVESLLRIAEGTSVHPDLVAQSLADVLAAALEQAKAEDARL
jgi:hypothetical protein